MESERFDALSRSFADRSSRRRALFGGGGIAAGLLGLTGAKAILAADPKTCVLQLTAKGTVGGAKGKSFDGQLTLAIGDNGAIDDGALVTADGVSHPIVGQATGRALDVRVDLGGGEFLALVGVGQQDMVLCRGQIDGTFAGPKFGDMGVWTTAKSSTGGGSTSSGNASGGTSTGGSSTGGSSTGGNAVGGNATGGNAVGGNAGNGSSSTGNSSGGGNAGGNASGGGNAGGNASGNSSGGGGNSSGGGSGDCASGVVCGGTCCVPRDGFTPDQISCDGNFCSCTYSCAAAGCPNGGTDHSFAIACEDRPNALCGENCNFPTDNGCGDVTCDNTSTLDLDSCTCVPNA